MADFKVTASQLNTQAESLQDLNGRFKSAIEQLVTSETSLKSMWEGEANDAFHAAFTSDKAKMDEFYNLIITYIERLNSIATRYEQTERTNTEIASNRTSAEFSSQGNTIISLTGEMMNIVASMSSVWEGEAASSYMTKFKSLESDIQTLNRMIQEHVNDLEQMANLYSTAEQQNVDDAASLSSGVIS